MVCFVSITQRHLGEQLVGAKLKAVRVLLDEKVNSLERSLVVTDNFVIENCSSSLSPIHWTFLLNGTENGPLGIAMAKQNVVEYLEKLNLQTAPLYINRAMFEYQLKAMTLNYGMPKIAYQPNQYEITVSMGKLGNSRVNLGIKYLYLKYFKPSMLNDFYHSLISLEVERLKSPIDS